MRYKVSQHNRLHVLVKNKKIKKLFFLSKINFPRNENKKFLFKPVVSQKGRQISKIQQKRGTSLLNHKNALEKGKQLERNQISSDRGQFLTCSKPRCQKNTLNEPPVQCLS
jgi:hypothetical protein